MWNTYKTVKKEYWCANDRKWKMYEAGACGIDSDLIIGKNK